MTEYQKQKAAFSKEVERLTCEAVKAVNALSCFLTGNGDKRRFLANQALYPLWEIQGWKEK